MVHTYVLNQAHGTSLPDLWTQAHNGVDSENVPFLEAQNAVLLHLCEHGVPCPRPRAGVDGSMLAVVRLPVKDGHVCGRSLGRMWKAVSSCSCA